jgi:hypothetical protein
MKIEQDLQTSRTRYESLLQSAIDNNDFYVQVAMILHDNPYFFPGYLEMIWAADERHDNEAMIALKLIAYQSALKLFKSKKLVKDALPVAWRTLEYQALEDLLVLIYRDQSFTYQKRLQSYLMKLSLSKIIKLKTISGPPEPRCLKVVEKFDSNLWQDELDNLPYFWWQINNVRAQKISHHQHTRTILLRTTNNKTEDYIAHDGVHESQATSYASILPSVHNLVLDFAKRHNYALGRVAVVKMRPQCQSYRHFDSEVYLRGRDRFHLVLQAGEKNILSSGLESVEAKTGELWFFDNSVMHRAHNQSDIERIHVIFDGYPLANKG